MYMEDIDQTYNCVQNQPLFFTFLLPKKSKAKDSLILIVFTLAAATRYFLTEHIDFIDYFVFFLSFYNSPIYTH